VGLDQHIKSPQKKTSKVPLVGKKKSTAVDVPPVVDPNTISDHEVQVRSGFRSLLQLLYYIAVVCDGNILMMVETTTCLTWFEEWFFFFEMLWGRSLQRWVDAEHVYKLFLTRGIDASWQRGEPEGNFYCSRFLLEAIANSRAEKSFCQALLLVIGQEMSAPLSD
jgi:hypothetical protein